MYVTGKIKMTKEEYEKIALALENNTKEEEDIDYYGNFSDGLFYIEDEYGGEFESFLSILIEIINIYSLSSLYVINYDGCGNYYIYPGMWEWRKDVPQCISKEFQHHIDTHKEISQTKNNLGKINEDESLEI